MNLVPDMLAKMAAAAGLDLEVMTRRGFAEKIRRDLPLWEDAAKASGARAAETR